jgi:hypothetical protein
MSTQTDTTPARAAMERLGVSPMDIVRGTDLSTMSVNRMILGVRNVRRSTAVRFASFDGFTDDERTAIVGQGNVMCPSDTPSTRTVRPDSPGWAALDRRGLSVSTVASETGVPVRSVYKVLNSTAGMSLLVRFLGYYRLTDTERVAIVEANGYFPYTVLGRLVGLSAERGQPMTTIVRGQG